MLSPEQQKWIDHLQDDNKTKITPYDPDSEQKFEEVKKKILSHLGEGIEVVHRGATSLKISGQGELDIYIPVAAEQFDTLLNPLEKLFGKPGSVYPLDRARFVTYMGETKAEVFLINEKSKSWINGVIFENYLRTHPLALDAYRKLKEDGSGLSTREYYRQKIEFINDILEKAEMEQKS
jgi:GrpB-like predicted nucleotidyltransferase (UPF0157 family)